MTHLQRLSIEKEAREAEDRDKVKLKELVSKISDLHSTYDGVFLEKLEQFLNNYSKKELIPESKL